MQDVILKSGRDTILVAIPFVLFLFFGLFRLDELFSRSGKKAKRPLPGGGMDADGEPFLADPDGRPVRLQRRQR
jgi:hypothetical protein